MDFYLHIYSHILVTVVKDFVEENQQSKTILDGSLQEWKCLGHLVFLNVFAGSNNLCEGLQRTEITVQFKTKILNSVRPKENSTFKIRRANGIKLVNRLRLQFNHLNKNKFQYNFRATIDPTCNCGLKPETNLHYLLRCNPCVDLRIKLLNDICNLNSKLKNCFTKSFWIFSSVDRRTSVSTQIRK